MAGGGDDGERREREGSGFEAVGDSEVRGRRCESVERELGWCSGGGGG